MRGHTVKTLVQEDLQSVRITFFTVLPRVCARGSNRMNDLRREVRCVRLVASAIVIANLRVGHPANLPDAKQMFEPRPLKTFLREIPKDQVSFGKRRVLRQLPRFPNREISQEILGGIGSERNRDEIAEQLGGLDEIRFVSRQKQKSKRGEFTKQRHNVTGLKVSTGSERESLGKGAGHADEEIQAGADRDVAAAD